MTLANVGSSHVSHLAPRRAAQGQYRVGDAVHLRVDRRLTDTHFLASLRDSQRVVSSSVPLNVGSTIRATVTAVGDKLELRYVGTDKVAAAMEEQEAASEDSLADFAARYAVELGEGQRDLIRRAASKVDDPVAMAAGGVFLGKLSLPIENKNLQAMYEAQNWERVATSPAAADVVVLMTTEPAQLQSLAAVIGNALDAEAAAASAPPESADAALTTATLLAGPSVGGAGLETQADDDWRERARQLLNEQDESSLAYRYGVLPVLIGDQLVELDLVHFRERRQAEHGADARRLIMTFKTQTLGRVEVIARAINDRLSVSVTTDDAGARGTLESRSQEVLDLLSRLGWNVESVAYRVDSDPQRAPRHVLDHVLNADTLSRLV